MNYPQLSRRKRERKEEREEEREEGTARSAGLTSIVKNVKVRGRRKPAKVVISPSWAFPITQVSFVSSFDILCSNNLSHLLTFCLTN